MQWKKFKNIGLQGKEQKVGLRIGLCLLVHIMQKVVKKILFFTDKIELNLGRTFAANDYLPTET